QGSGYLDMNWGASGIEDAFARWDWSRTADAAEPVMLYDVARRDGTPGSLALRFRRDGTADAFDPPERHPLFNGLWRMPRWTQSEAAPRMLARLEDAPFYARSEIETTLFGERVRAMHETFDGDRFRQRWVKALLPWRMPRVPSGALSPVGKFF
ncbi:MAG: carotenoid 1,2-hydratase, partial [Pseudomonadota bacterium]